MALNPKQFGTVMKNARMDKKLTQAELAEILDLSLSYLKDLERFKNTPSLEVFAKNIQYFNLSADTVIYPDKVRLNCYYYRNYSFIKDIEMIFATVLGFKVKFAGEEI